MNRKSLTVLFAMIVSLNGCTLCCAPFDDDYNAFGGKYDRVDRRCGRVGSAFDPADAVGGGVNGVMGDPPGDLVQREPNEDGEVEERVANRKITYPSGNDRANQRGGRRAVADDENSPNRESGNVYYE